MKKSPGGISGRVFRNSSSKLDKVKCLNNEICCPRLFHLLRNPFKHLLKIPRFLHSFFQDFLWEIFYGLLLKWLHGYRNRSVQSSLNSVRKCSSILPKFFLGFCKKFLQGFVQIFSKNSKISYSREVSVDSI